MASSKILFTIAGLHPESGGPSRSVPALCYALSQAGVEVEIVSLDYGAGFGKALIPTGASLRTTLVDCSSRLARRTQWTSAFPSALRERCKAAEIQILHDTGLWLLTNHAAATVCSELNLPRIVSPRGMLTPWALQYRGWKKRVAWALYQHRDLQDAQMLHATSRAESDALRALGFKQPVAVIPNGVDLPPFEDGRRYAPHPSRLPEPQRESGANSELRTLLFLSRLHPIKGLLHLVDAWAAVRPKQWQVLIAGSGDESYRAQVEAAIGRHGLRKDFSFIGSVESDAKWNLYQQANLFVLPSYSENFGIVVAEALGCGVPVVTTRATPWSELVEHRCGWWVEVGAEPLAEALREATALTDAERREMGCRGRALVESKYTWPRIAAQMGAVYEWMLDLGPRPGCILN